MLDASDRIDPSKIIVKPKLHTLVHAPEDVRRTGPLVHNSTEVFEAFNAVFRFSAILSNRKATSRDVALKFCDLDGVKHLLSGGYYQSGQEWVQAAPAVLLLLKNNPVLQQYLGWSQKSAPCPGAPKFCDFTCLIKF